MNDYNFGNFIFFLREQKGYTQAEIAAMLNVTPAAVSKWENGESKPRLETLFKLADILGVKAEELIAGRKMYDAPINAEAINKIYEKYDVISKVESHDKPIVKLLRIVAFLIDWNIIGISVFVLLAVTTSIPANTASSMTKEVLAVILLCIFALYPIGVALRDVMFKGRSIGKRICGLVPINIDNAKKPSAGRLILRDMFFFIQQIDVIIMLVTGRSVGDYVARTVVVKKEILNTQPNSPDQQLEEINSYTVKKEKNYWVIAVLAVAFFIIMGVAWAIAVIS